MMRTANQIEEANAAREIEKDAGVNSPQTKPVKLLTNGVSPDVGKATQFKPGQSGNPGGKRKGDTAKRIAKRIFDDNEEALYEVYLQSALKGNPYTFKELAERGFGKLKEQVEITTTETDDSNLSRRIAELEHDLGYARAIDEAGRTGIAQAGASKTNGEAKAHDLLPQ